jgi:hypothetical protein
MHRTARRAVHATVESGGSLPNPGAPLPLKGARQSDSPTPQQCESPLVPRGTPIAYAVHRTTHRRVRKADTTMENSKELSEKKNDELENLIEGDDEQLTVEVPVEVRAGVSYGCCKRLA